MVMPNPALLQDVKGFLDEEEGRRIYALALEVGGRGPCLEIGSYCGKSTLYLGAACRESGSILFSVDHHRGSEEQQPGEEYFDPELWDRVQAAALSGAAANGSYASTDAHQLRF